MMNPAAVSVSGGELVVPGNPVPFPPSPSLFLPIMDQLESTNLLSSELLTISSANMEANVPALLAPAYNVATDYTSSDYGLDHNMFQFYPSASQYLAVGNPYSYFSGRTFLPTLQEYYFPTMLEENMASFGAVPRAQVGLNYGRYPTYYCPIRGGYAYGNDRPRCQAEPPRCQVEGCTADLSRAKRYHRRHRVCEHHSKAPIVITAGAIMPQRFCQQCSRFQDVDEFDDAKKSCRQRLADHNRRRRKPKPSNNDVLLKRRAYANNCATAKGGSSGKSMGTGDLLGGSSSKEHDRTTSHEQVAREPVDPKGKSPMKQQAHVPQPNLQQLGFPFLLSPGTGSCLPQSQLDPGGITYQR